MNFFSFLIEYLSNERLKDILKYYESDKSGTKTELVEHLVTHVKFEIKDFIKFFQKAELVNLSKVFKLRSTGNKSKLWDNLLTVFTFETEIFDQNVNGQISKQEKKEINATINALESLLYEDVRSILRRFADYGDFSKEEALKKLMKLHREVPEEIISDVFDYFHRAYIEISELVGGNLNAYSGLGDNYWLHGKARQAPDDFFPFELDLSKKYPKIPKPMLLGMLEFHFFWHYIK
jgi:hypothetical protein